MDGEIIGHVDASGPSSSERLFYSTNDHLGQPYIGVRVDEKLSHEQFISPFGRLEAEFTAVLMNTWICRTGTQHQTGTDNK